MRILMGWRLKHTAGFVPGILTGHFEKHVLKPSTRCFSRWDVPTEEVYELLADRFAGRPAHAGLHTGVVCVRSAKRAHRNGRIVKYDHTTEEFIVIDPHTREVFSYYLPKPKLHHPFATNLEYFNDTLKF